ncbi:MAG: TRAM domain-containing protein [Limnochordaceae bacterium]|nr:TRAM domain-containing protein [Limnochordaceae bacterium]
MVTAGTVGVVATTPGVTTASGVVTVSGGRAAPAGAMADGMAESGMASTSGEGTAEAQAPAVTKPASSRSPASLNVGPGVAGAGGAGAGDRVGTASMTGAAGAARMGGTIGVAGASEPTGQPVYSGIPKLLDTSAIIDGRIADVAATGFLEGPLVVPGFVIAELQRLADSADVLKRNRGRRGLDLLGQMRKDLPTEVVILEDVLADNGDVDLTLVRLARHLRARVVTNDYNLNKVARLHGVGVLNLNDLANAVKPVVLPGEEMEVRVLRDGKEQGQGVGYLDDGTMIVIDGGREYVGHLVTVLVTSVLQTSAGRMIFARPKGQVEKVGQASNA